ncbi:MAG: PASTA domain-containing protein, partial [Pseudomonadota bacterium]
MPSHTARPIHSDESEALSLTISVSVGVLLMRYLVLVLLTLLMSIYVPAANATTCDIDTDGDVDRLDIRAITLARNTPAAGTDDPRDADSDGTITILDARTCVTRCTLAACAEPAPDLITVPELVGTSQSAAETAITGAGLTVGVVTLENSGTVPAGSVIRQEPAGGNDVAPGTAVNLVVSLGEELTSVPDIVGLSQSAAEATITGAGLVVGTITTENSDTVPAGDVISQDPASGTDVAPGTAVNLVVSLGEELVTVPSVVGVSQTAAESAITSAGLLVGSITTDNSDTVPAGDVISQNPVDGSVVAPGTVVDLVISIGEALIPTPNVVGLSQADAEIELLAVGLVLGSVTTATSDTVPAGAVISQTPPAGELVALSTTVDLVVSSGAAAEPGLIGGPPDGAAVAFIELVPPAPSPAEALGELFIFDRLLVSIEPDATVAEVNDAFRRHDALISASSPNTLRVTVQIERQPSMAALNTKVAAMRAEPAFYDVDLARRIGVTELPIFADKSDIDTYENELAPYFATKFPAVWNLRDRMLRTPDATNLSIVVSDYFPKYEHPELPTLIGSDLPRSNLHHGLGVTSVIAAGYDGTGLTGVIPVEPANPIYAIDVSPITTSDGVLETYSNLPPTGDLVINSSWNYKTSAPLTQEELLGVALDALDVKKFYASMTDRVLHVVAAGNESRLADTLSPYAIATKFDDPCDITTDPPASLPLTPKDLAYCEEYKAPLTDDLGEFLDNPLPNILIVGSAANDRSISSFSNFNYEVAANGEGIIVACADLSLDPTACIPFGRSGSTDITDFSQGTSFAAPQITGLTFIMQRLRPDVPLFLIELLILNSGDRADTLLSNAYSAVLELDRVPPGGGDALSGLDSLNVANSVRGAILDVRDHGGDPDTPAQDDAFTEVDLEAFIDAFIGDPLEEIDAEPGALNFSRFDLNGDG